MGSLGQVFFSCKSQRADAVLFRGRSSSHRFPLARVAEAVQLIRAWKVIGKAVWV
jgi:hypothetical protein